MRNETVERIVNLLFQDVEMTDEVQALYDETMSNCQERYQDMTSRGLSDDDAIAAVVESLKGMEDVISQYPKKSESPEAEEAPKSADVPVDDDGDGEQTDFTFHPADIGRIEMTMVCDDVHLEESPDGDVHVLFEDVEGAKASICRIEDGILRVCRDPDAPKRNRSSFTVSGSFANTSSSATRRATSRWKRKPSGTPRNSSSTLKNSRTTCRRWGSSRKAQVTARTRTASKA